MNENHVLFVHIIGILVLTFGPLFARTDAHRILYLQVIVAVTLQWVLLGGRCSLSMVEHALRSEEQNTRIRVRVYGNAFRNPQVFVSVL